MLTEVRIAADRKRSGSQLGQVCKSRINLAFGARVYDGELQPEGAGHNLVVSQYGLGIGIRWVDEQRNDGRRGDQLMHCDRRLHLSPAVPKLQIAPRPPENEPHRHSNWRYVGDGHLRMANATSLNEPAPRSLGGSILGIIRAEALTDQLVCERVNEVDAWIRNVIAQYTPALNREICPFVTPALERRTLYYAPVASCNSPADVIAVMEELISQFDILCPLDGADKRLKTLAAIFVDVRPDDAERIVIAAHHELKNRCTKRGLMVGEFAPGYRLPSTRNPALNTGEAPAPVLVLRHMIISDRRFLEAEDQWMAAWATRFGADRIPLFRPLSRTELGRVGRYSREMNIESGRVLCRQGDPGDELFLIVHGDATVSRNGKQIATLGPGMYLGELALLTDAPRNATVTASTDMVLLVLDRHSFRQVVDTTPSVVHKLLAGLAKRLSDAEARLNN